MSTEDKIPKKTKIKKKTKSILRNKKFLIFLVFVFISSVLWFLNAIEKEYETPIKYKLKYINLPLKDVAVKESTQEVFVTVKGFGYNLLKYKFAFRNIPITVDYKKYKFEQLYSDKNTFYILSSRLGEFVMQRFNNDVSFVEIYPDTLYIKTVKAAKKKVPLIENIEFSLEESYHNPSKIKLIPDSLIIYGSKETIEPINSLETESLKLGIINSSQQLKAAIIIPEGIATDLDSVDFRIAIEKCADTSLAVPIHKLNFPKTENFVIFPETVDLVFKVSVQYLDKIKASEFTIIADYDENKLGTVPLKITKQPNSVTNLKMSRNDTQIMIESK
ncbi:MAG: hypothetical protein GX879_02350 [Bacteroidales bacterium]|nr:hypothetical protein [Bacteroidales bacterium]